MRQYMCQSIETEDFHLGTDGDSSSSVEGTLQRIDYRSGLFTVIADGRQWSFEVSPQCELRFDGRPTILHCFQPLDHVIVTYERVEGGCIARALSGRIAFADYT